MNERNDKPMTAEEITLHFLAFFNSNTINDDYAWVKGTLEEFQEQIRQQSRDEALEAAERICLDDNRGWPSDTAVRLAFLIRKLKGETDE